MKETLIFIVLLLCMFTTLIYVTQLIQNIVRMIVFKQQETVGEGTLRFMLIVAMSLLWTIYIIFC